MMRQNHDRVAATPATIPITAHDPREAQHRMHDQFCDRPVTLTKRCLHCDGVTRWTRKLIKTRSKNSLHPLLYFFRSACWISLLQALGRLHEQVIGDEISFQVDAKETVVSLGRKTYRCKIARAS